MLKIVRDLEFDKRVSVFKKGNSEIELFRPSAPLFYPKDSKTTILKRISKYGLKKEIENLDQIT